MKTLVTLSSGREIFLHHEEPIVKQPISGMTEWVAALRSGKYEQCTAKLHSLVGFCCLGVKRDLEGCNWQEWDGKFMDTENCNQTWFYHGKSGLTDEGRFPFQVQLSYERSSQTYDGPPYWQRCEQLSELNDQGFTFSEIADIIELLFSDKDFPIVTSSDYSINRVIDITGHKDI
jgi:hypothetical protein